MTTIDHHRADDLAALARRSHAVIRQHQHPSGAYPASPTFSAYRGYAWLRDGGFTAEGMSRYGDVASVDAFHDWVDRTLGARRDRLDEVLSLRSAGREVPGDLLLPTRFTLDGADGTDEWWDFQTDGYGTWLWSVVTHARRHGGDLRRWRRGIEVAVDFACAFWAEPCYDWWEEHDEQRHVSTLAAVVGGLEAVAEAGVLDEGRAARCREVASAARALVLAEGVADGHLTKWLGDNAVDGSLPACIVPFGLVEVGSPLARATLTAVASDLDADGGVHRFLADVFYGGGQWLLLSCFLGWNLAAQGERDGALRLLEWVAGQVTDDGEMPEQVGHDLLHPGSRDEWVERWGEVATPLLWSHGMYLVLADELGRLQEVPA
ncbi:glycoside hydrolase family 15 protein [Phycicoccus flavus]|uniref:glycoside hydrolase family 15 protein n=1 Tax=Phycicoccus flavus TaxID=2502783 RepID=UPI000FEB85AA|nr:glycoside hydrolase family 15 protein [Phycicoccus flavus]NHA69808.1 glycoside hydrolase family 15 [Phycicoccus flavus]